MRSGERVLVLRIVFLGAWGLVVTGLAWLMLGDTETWLLRSHRNRWAYRDVPTRRGALLDAHGTVLVNDRPSWNLEAHYRTFRREHAVGAVVHAANLLARSTIGNPHRYGYIDPHTSGPRAAWNAVAELHVGALFDGSTDALVLDAESVRDLRFYAVSLFAAASDRSRRRVYQDLAASARETPDARVEDVLRGLGGSDLRAAFDARWTSLQTLDGALRSTGAVMKNGGLLERLDRWRREFEDSRSVHLAAIKNGEVEADEDSSPGFERLHKTVGTDVSFELAASLTLQRAMHPGLGVRSAVERVRHLQDVPSLGGWLGRLAPLQWAEYAEQVDELSTEMLPESTVDELVPDGAVSLAAFESELRGRALDHMSAVLFRDGRRGLYGIEQTVEDLLSGRPGLRLVERDKAATERVLWSRLDVEPGADVKTTFDLDLQRVLEVEVAAAFDDAVLRRDGDPGFVEVALAVIDAKTGAILAVGGRPFEHLDPNTKEMAPRARPPGAAWYRNGVLGSVVKPIVMMEQLDSMRRCREHVDPSEFAACGGSHDPLRRFNTKLTCLAAHGTDSRDGLIALRDSCNVYFYEAAIGFGQAGLLRAYRRVGWLESGKVDLGGGTGPPPMNWPKGTWQDGVDGVPSRTIATPRMYNNILLPRRAIGYGVEVSPVQVARAYAGLATGVLPPLHVVRGLPNATPAVPLDVADADLDLVRRGMRMVIQDGSAQKVRSLDPFREELLAKTGTGQVTKAGDNNAWFAGFLQPPGGASCDAQLCFAAVAYYVPDRSYGGAVAGAMVGKFLQRVVADATLRNRYFPWRVDSAENPR